MNLAQRIGQEFKTLRNNELAPIASEVAGKVDAADLATVATSGLYTDLIGAPTAIATAEEIITLLNEATSYVLDLGDLNG